MPCHVQVTSVFALCIAFAYGSKAQHDDFRDSGIINDNCFITCYSTCFCYLTLQVLQSAIVVVRLSILESFAGIASSQM
jgi:hypothetical protein